MVILSLIACLSSTAKAGVLRGIALENFTGLPLARARVRLMRLEGDRLKPAGNMIASRGGEFVFDSLEEGYYMLSGVRAGFAETRFGQRRNNGPAAPIFVPRDGSPFVELRLKRLGGVTGRTLDENRVGIPGIQIIAYTAAIPMRNIATATSDDRGVYRIPGLLPGRYLIRTGPAQLEDALNLLPTYYPLTSVALEQARPVSVDLDTDTTDIDIQPAAGSLISLTVHVTGCLGPAQITLSSDTGRREVKAPCTLGPVQFNGLAPGDYEVLAEGDADGRRLAGFLSFFLDRERQVGITVRPLPEVTLRLSDGAGLAIRDAGVIARRRDLAGEGPEQTLTAERVPLTPGFWQIAARPPASHYLSDIKLDAGAYRRTRKDLDPDWFDFYVDYSLRINVSLLPRPARLSGRVTLGGKAAIAAPVYLLPTTAQTRRRMNGLRTTHTDAQGNYRFQGLAPGAYLILSSFDVTDVNEETMAAAQARAVTFEEGGAATQDLEIYQLP